MTIQFYKSKKNGQWYWRAIAANGKKVAGGCEGYKRKAGAVKGFRSLQKIIATGNVQMG